MPVSTTYQSAATRQSFWSLISDEQYNIRIPRIQRDYAQGRKGSEAKQIRQALLKDIFDSLKSNEPIDFNFIYGNISIEDNGKKVFVPIDGQQRLTTLFLLYWYFATWSDRLQDDAIQALSRFQYDTRFVAGSFCEKLVHDVRVDLKNLAATDRSLIDVIKDYYWFFSSYERDATIQGMLVMLQSIHEIVKELPDQTIVDGFYDRLIAQDCPITFLFLDIEDLGLTDEIYIKMNARGKALTRFENFKAQLSGYISHADDAFSREFLGNINGLWSTFFWHEEYRAEISDNGVKQKSKVFDEQILNLFRFFMFNEYMTRVDMADSSQLKYLAREVLGTLSKESDYEFISRLFTDEFRLVAGHRTDKANVDVDTFRLLNVLINVLAKRKETTGSINFVDNSLFSKKYYDEEGCFRRLIRSTDEKSLNYEEQLIVYAEYLFLIHYAKPDYSFDQVEELTNWIRFVYNVTQNMNYNTVDDYMRTVVRIRKIVEEGNALDILSYAAKIVRKEYAANSGFGIAEIAMKEECIKAHLILKSNDWRSSIVRAENSFLGSQLSALLSFSGIWQVYESQMTAYEVTHDTAVEIGDIHDIMDVVISNLDYRKKFDVYLNKINKIFDGNDLKPEMEQNSILRRALLTYGGGDSYMLPAGKPVKCFLDVIDRDNSFKRLFRDENKKNKSDTTGVRVYFKYLLDDLDETRDFVPQLESIISRMVYDRSNRWKKYFIEMPEILESLYRKGGPVPENEAVFKNAKRYISMRSADQILLLEKTKTSSLNREYYSYVLYRKALKDGVVIDYTKNVSDDTPKFAFYTDALGQTVKVSYVCSPDTGEYQYIAVHNDTILHATKSMENMLCFIKGITPPTEDVDDFTNIVEQTVTNSAENTGESTENTDVQGYEIVLDEEQPLADENLAIVENDEQQGQCLAETEIPIVEEPVVPNSNEALSIEAAFNENIFNRFRRLCADEKIFTVGDLAHFNFDILSQVPGIGKSKIEAILKRYSELVMGNITFESSLPDIVALFDSIHDDIAGADIDFLEGIGVRQKSIKKLKTAGYETMGTLASITSEALKKLTTGSDFAKIMDAQSILGDPIEKIIEARLQELRQENDYSIVLLKEEGHTLQEIGDLNNVTRERIRQIIKRFNESISPLMRELQRKLMNERSYFKEDDYISIFDDRDKLQIVAQWFKNSEALEYLDFADTFIKAGETTKQYQTEIVSVVSDFLGDGLQLSEHLDEYDSLMKEYGYPFMDEVALLNLAQANGYWVYRNTIFKGKPSYGLLCSKIVEKYFPNGVKLYEGSEDLQKIRELSFKEYGDIGISDDDRAFSARLSDFLILSGKGRCTAESNIHIEMWLLEKIKEYIDLLPQKEIYYAALFSTFERELAEYSNVDNYNFLHGVLKLYYSDEYDFNDRDYLTKTGKNLASGKISGRLLSFIMTMRRPVTKADLRRQFPGISDSVVLNAVSSDNNLMQWEYNKYYAMNCLRITEDDKKYLHDKLTTIMEENNGYCSDDLLFDMVVKERTAFVDANGIREANNLYYICMKLFQNEFDFRRPHITQKNLIQNLSVKDVALHMMNYPRVLSFKEYQAVAEKLHWSAATVSAVFYTIEQDYVRVSDDIYIKLEDVHIDSSVLKEIDQMLRTEMSNQYGYVSLHWFDAYQKLPEIGYEWNEFLLRSVVDKFLPDFKVIEIRSTDRRYEKGLVVDENAPFVEYSDLVLHVLREMGEHTIEEARLSNLLVHWGLTHKMIPKELYSIDGLKYADGIFTIM